MNRMFLKWPKSNNSIYLQPWRNVFSSENSVPLSQILFQPCNVETRYFRIWWRGIPSPSLEGKILQTDGIDLHTLYNRPEPQNFYFFSFNIFSKTKCRFLSLIIAPKVLKANIACIAILIRNWLHCLNPSMLSLDTQSIQGQARPNQYCQKQIRSSSPRGSGLEVLDFGLKKETQIKIGINIFFPQYTKVCSIWSNGKVSVFHLFYLSSNLVPTLSF